MQMDNLTHKQNIANANKRMERYRIYFCNKELFSEVNDHMYIYHPDNRCNTHSIMIGEPFPIITRIDLDLLTIKLIGVIFDAWEHF